MSRVLTTDNRDLAGQVEYLEARCEALKDEVNRLRWQVGQLTECMGRDQAQIDRLAEYSEELATRLDRERFGVVDGI